MHTAKVASYPLKIQEQIIYICMNEVGEQFNKIKISEKVDTNEWRRPNLPDLNPSKDPLNFQETETSFYITKNNSHFNKITGKTKQGSVTVFRMFGVTEQGNTVCCHIHGFDPYLFFMAPSNFSETDCEPFKEVLDNAVRSELKLNSDDVQDCVLTVEIIKNKNSSDTQKENKFIFLKITVSLPNFIETCKTIIQTKQIYQNFLPNQFIVSKVNDDFLSKFVTDAKIKKFGWIKLSPNNWEIRGKNNYDVECDTTSQLEVDVAWDQLIVLNQKDTSDKVAPIIFFIFSIECKEKSPNASKDPVVQIFSKVYVQGDKKPLMKKLFTLKASDDIQNYQVEHVKDESELLQKWNEFVFEIDPEIITGKSVNIDIPYLIKRAEVLNIQGFNSCFKRINRRIKKQ